MELLRNIFEWATAVIHNWHGYVTGTALAFGLELVKKFREWEPSKKAFAGIVAFGLLASFFSAWREKKEEVENIKKELVAKNKQLDQLSQPKFKLGWGTSILGNDVVIRGKRREQHTHIFLPVTVMNHGAPSITKQLKLTAKIRDGREFEGSAFIPSQPEFVFHMPDGPIRFSTSASLAARGTANPIPTGGQVDGYMFYEFPTGILSELEDHATVFVLQVTDIAGSTHEGRITMSGPKPTHMGTSPELLPLH